MLFTPTLHENPIELNELWLINLGFRPLNGYEFSVWLDEWECKSLFIEDHYWGIRVGTKDVFTWGKIKYVHDLQMLYYSITKKELTIHTIAML